MRRPADRANREMSGDPVPPGLRRGFFTHRAIVAEPFGVMTDVIPKGLDPTRIQQVIESLKALGEQIAAKPVVIQSPDPDDQMFIEVAVAGVADAIVTGNVAFPSCRRASFSALWAKHSRSSLNDRLQLRQRTSASGCVESLFEAQNLGCPSQYCQRRPGVARSSIRSITVRLVRIFLASWLWERPARFIAWRSRKVSAFLRARSLVSSRIFISSRKEFRPEPMCLLLIIPWQPSRGFLTVPWCHRKNVSI